jgi:endonuclease/exonuclease/phosphatase (EEP) superfamily protein YafD
MDKPSLAATSPAIPVACHPRRRGRWVAVCAWLYLALALAGWGLLRVGDLWWPATLFLLAPRWMLTLPALVLLPLAAWLRRWSVPVVLAAGVIVLLAVSGFNIPWSHLVHSPPHGPRLRVLTCNMHYHGSAAPRLEAFIHEARPDIVAVQEWDEDAQPAEFSGKDWSVDRKHHHFLASRYPIRRTLLLGRDSENPQGALRRYDIETHAGLVHFFSLHMLSPRQGVYEALRERQGTQRVQEETDLRWIQSESVVDHTTGLEDPILVVGDFNTAPESALWRRVWGRYRDAFDAGGWGWGYTFNGARTSVRIDHVLVGPGWYVDRCWVGPDVGSPHRPVVADLIWTGDPP